MKIWIDGYEANVQNRVGSGQYALEILGNLWKIDQKNDYTTLLPGKPLDDLPKERPGWQYKILKPDKFKTWLAIPLALYLAKKKPDVFFSPTHYIPRFSPVKRICTIFDLSFVHFPELFKKIDLWQLKLWTEYSIKNSHKILAISNFTKQDIIENYGISPDKVIVTHLGYDKNIFKSVKDEKIINQVLNKYHVKRPYIIYIGTIQPRKNLIRLMEAYAKSNIEANLVIVGKTKGSGRQGWMYQDILDTPKKLTVEDRVTFTGFVPTEDLPALLSASDVFVLPSLWEGFGIPILEAMACETPVVVSNVSALPEIAGKAATLVDPYSVDSIKKALESLLKDDKLRQKKIQLGKTAVQKFSWQRCTKETLKALEEVANEPFS